MRKFISKIVLNVTALALMIVYLTSTMGYGIHECIAQGTMDVIMLFGESPCEYVHSHRLSDGTLICHSHSSNNVDSHYNTDTVSELDSDANTTIHNYCHADSNVHADDYCHTVSNVHADGCCHEHSDHSCNHNYNHNSISVVHNSDCCKTTILTTTQDQQTENFEVNFANHFAYVAVLYSNFQDNLLIYNSNADYSLYQSSLLESRYKDKLSLLSVFRV